MAAELVAVPELMMHVAMPEATMLVASVPT
jgi:hypothetical protein